MLEYVFVYGTLRKYESNYSLIEAAELVSEQAYIGGELWDTGYGYPAMVLSQQSKVYGELYHVNAEQLRNLDRLEGYYGPEGDNDYLRVTQTVYTDNLSYSAYVYIYTQPPVDGRCIASGDWKERRMVEEPLVYFAYGSCMDLARIKEYGVDHLFQDVIGCGVLRNYELRFTRKASDGRGRADIVESMGGRVEGKLYEIGKEALEYLLVREGVSGKAYRPAFVTVEHEKSTLHNVLTFIVVDKQREELSPPVEYMEEILRGAKGLVSDEYYQLLVQKGDLLLDS